MQIKKYSFGFDVFDFTARIYSEKNIDLVDLEEQEIKKNKEKLFHTQWFYGRKVNQFFERVYIRVILAKIA